MKISVRWLNEYLEPAGISAADAERALTFAGFPIESATTIPGAGGGDTVLDVEVTSNRGDALSHIGVAREIAAATGRKLRLPAPGAPLARGTSGGSAPVPTSPAGNGSEAGTPCSVDNQVPDLCPLFTARVIRGVKVGPSPAWLVEALAAVGQRSINNVVDVTNFVAFEYGQPSHVFDPATIPAGPGGKPGVVIRRANKGETLKLLDGKTITLRGDEPVVADQTRAISLAGVMGGFDTQVTARTTDVLLEAATWDPLAVRRTARRFNLRTDAGHRFERLVDPRTIDPAADRAGALIALLAGGSVLAGVVRSGPAPKPLLAVRLRPSRCRAILGIDVPASRMREILEAHGLQVRPEGVDPASKEPLLSCTVPAHRPDLEREIDLIEEVARTQGFDALPIHDTLAVRVAPPQREEEAVRELADVLSGLGFYEAITATFVPTAWAKPFLPAGFDLIGVSDERRAADPIVRPSALPSLLACRRKNQDGGVSAELGVGTAGVRLYEISSAFAQSPSGHVERVNLALIADAAYPTGAKAFEQRQTAVRLMRGAIESVVDALGGSAARAEFIPLKQSPIAAFDPAACAEVRVNGAPAGICALIRPDVKAQFGLDTPVVAAELSLDSLTALYPPKPLVHALPQFPPIERDLSLIVDETISWSAIDSLVAGTRVPLLEAWSFVGAYRGPQAGQGKKSVTFRMRFRDPARTLRHEEVDPQVRTLIAAAKRDLKAEIRTV